MKKISGDIKFWTIGIIFSVFSLFYLKLDANSIDFNQVANTTQLIINEREDDSYKIVNPDLVKRVSEALFSWITNDR